MNPLSLAYLTCAELSPPEVVSVAAAAGCQHIGVRLHPATPQDRLHPLLDDKALMRETLARLDDTGVRVLELEIVRLGPMTSVADHLRMFEAGAQLGAKNLVVVGDDTERERLVERFGEVCDAARPFGLTAMLEFMAYSAVTDLNDAAQVLRQAGRSNAAILVDALHFDSAGSTLEQLGALPVAWLRCLQVCDAPGGRPLDRDALIRTARTDRLMPGEGDIDLAGLLRTMPGGIPISIEVPQVERAARVPARQRVREAVAAVHRLVEQVA
jgi:sugar phosphate isomerase/epimerase